MTNKKNRQGIDSINFSMPLQCNSLLLSAPPPKSLYNQFGDKIMEATISCGKVNLFCNLPRVVRSNNVKPFGVDDFDKISEISVMIKEFISSYLSEHLKEQYNPQTLEELQVCQLECNITLPCEGRCTPSDVINLINLSISNPEQDNVLYQRPDEKCTYQKKNSSLQITSKNEYHIKVYDKTLERKRKNDFSVENNLVRIEIVLLKRRLTRILSKNISLESVLSAESFMLILDEYCKLIETEIIENRIKPFLNYCVRTMVEFYTSILFGRRLDQLIARHRNLIVDIEVLRRVLIKCAKDNESKVNYTRQRIYNVRKRYELPEDVIKTIKKFHDSL